MDDHGILRRKELDVDDEEGLLLLQEEFLKAGTTAQPAARVTRITRKAAGPSTAATAGQSITGTAVNQQVEAQNAQQQTFQTVQDISGEASSTAHVQQSQQSSESAAADHSMCPSIPGILSGVTERQITQPPAAPQPTQAAATATAAFPAAVHRKQSKFVLGRRQAAAAAPAAASAAKSAQAAAPAAAAAAAALGTADAPPTLVAGPGSSSRARDVDPVAAVSPAVAAVQPETAGINKENAARVADMSLEEIKEAQADLAGRFSPATLAFLKSRSNKRQQQQKQQQQQQQGPSHCPAIDSDTVLPSTHEPAASESLGGERAGTGADVGAGFRQGLLAGRPSTAKEPAAAVAVAVAAAAARDGGQAGATSTALQSATAASGAKGAAGAAGIRRGFLGGTATARKTSVQPPSAAAAAAAQKAPKPAAPAAAATAEQVAPGLQPPVARLRFSLDGQVLELADPKTPPVPDAEVLMRDNLSRAAGVVPQGYTLPEIRVLVRSSHAPQRAAGFRMLATILRRAQPTAMHVGTDGQLIAQPVAIDEPQQQQQQRHTGVHWSQVWEYAVVALRAAVLCRLGIDDDNAQVLSAAADAAAVLLGPSSSEVFVEEVGIVTPGLSWPLTRRVSLRRLSKAGAWDRVEGLVAAAAAAAQQQPEDSEPDSAEDLAAVDPLAGFMATDPLPRFRFLLQNRADTEAVLPLLCVLEAVVSSSNAAAEAVVRCKGLPEALLALLQLPVSNGASDKGSTHQQQQQQQHASGSRVAVLRLLRLLCASSQLACQLLRTAGLETAVQLLLCSSNSSSSSKHPAAAGGSSSMTGSGSADLESQLLLLEAIRIWMVATTHGVCLSHMDIMFQFVAVLLQPPTGAAAAAAAADTGSSSSSSDELLLVQWHLTAAAFQLVEVLVRHALALNNGAKTLGSQMISPGCAAAIAQEAASTWLNPRVLQTIAQVLVSLSDCQLPHPLDLNQPGENNGVRGNRVSEGLPGTAISGFSSSEGSSSQAAWLRVVAGMHPPLLVPPAFVVLSAFAAVLGYLNSYWQSLQTVPQQLAKELLSQLAAVGLTGLTGSSSSSSSGAAAGDTHAELAHVLLTCPRGTVAFDQQLQQKLGRALLQHCIGLLAAARGDSNLAAVATGSSSSSGGEILLQHCLSAAAASMVLSASELQQQLWRLSGQQEAEQQQQQQWGHLGLAAAAADVVACNALNWVATASQSLAFEPWHLAHSTMRQCQLRLLIRLARPLLKHLQGQPLSKVLQQQQQQQLLLWRIIDGLLSVLPLSGPGQEAQALQALQLLFGPEAVHAVQSSNPAAVELGSTTVQPATVQLWAEAVQAVLQLKQQGGPLAAAAAGIRADTLPDDSANGSAVVPYPCAPEAGSTTSGTAAAAGAQVQNWCETLLGGFAVTWLSVIAQGNEQQQQQHQGLMQPSAGNHNLAHALPLPRVYVAEAEGSRLPVPPEWLISEILALPTTSSSSSSAATMHPVSAALLLALGLEWTRPSCYMKAVQASHKLEALLQLLYLFNEAELLPDGQQQQFSGPAWQQPDARWAAAVLTEQYSRAVVSQQQQQEAACAVSAAADGASCSSSSSGADASVAPSIANQLKASCPVHQVLKSQQQQQQQQPQTISAAARPAGSSSSSTTPQLLLPSWAASPAGSQIVDRLVTDLAELSMGDPLFACHTALLLLPAAGVKLQRAVWGSMVDHGALHLLPPPGRCVLGAGVYQGLPPNDLLLNPHQRRQQQGFVDSNSGGSSPGVVGFFNAQLVGAMAKSLVQGDLRKALQLGSVTAEMALHGIAALCLDQRSWLNDTAAATVAAENGKSITQKPVSDAGMAVNVLRGVLRSCDLPLLKQLVQVGVCRSVCIEEQGRALVQAAHGDAALMHTVQQLLAHVQ